MRFAKLEGGIQRVGKDVQIVTGDALHHSEGLQAQMQAGAANTKAEDRGTNPAFRRGSVAKTLSCHIGFKEPNPVCHNLRMCGRYRLSRRKQIIEEQFEAQPWDDDWNPRYNIAPTQSVPVIRQHPTEPVRQISTMRWGLIPHWAKDPSIAAGTINAKSETAASKPAFRDPLKFRRCLIPADGFYEWKRNGTSKQPFCFEVRDGELFAFAGLWDGWKDSNGQWVKSCSILTTTPNAVTSNVHDRMPVILDRDSYDLWLDPGMQNVAVISELLKPLDARLMRCYPVSTRINHAANDDEACSAPVRLAQIQHRFFL